MKSMILLVAVFAVALSAYQFAAHDTPQSDQVRPVHSMWIHYNQMEMAEVAVVQCVSDGSGYWCPAAGVGGGGNARVV